VGCLAHLAICCRQKDDTSPPAVACSLSQTTLFFVLCQVTPYLTRTASRGVTWANGSLPVPAHSCATDGCGVSTRAFCTASSLGPRECEIVPLQSISRLAPRRHVRTSTTIPYCSTASAHPPHRTTPHTLAHAGCTQNSPAHAHMSAFCFDDRSLPRGARATATVASYLQIRWQNYGSKL
jgi:hypothetical protein